MSLVISTEGFYRHKSHRNLWYKLQTEFKKAGRTRGGKKLQSGVVASPWRHHCATRTFRMQVSCRFQSQQTSPCVSKLFVCCCFRTCCHCKYTVYHSEACSVFGADRCCSSGRFFGVFKWLVADLWCEVSSHSCLHTDLKFLSWVTTCYRAVI